MREEAKANRTPAAVEEGTTQNLSVAQNNPAETKSPPATDHSESKLPPGFMNSSLFITLGMMKSRCQYRCPCRCHSSRPTHSWRFPRVLDAIIGSLFVGYTSNPRAPSGCDLEECSQTRSTRLRLAYSFPLWFLNYTVHTLIETSTASPFTLALVTYHRIKRVYSDDNILFQVNRGNVSGVKRILQANRAALLTVEHRDGLPVLMVALRGKCRWGKTLDMIKLLLQAGADPDQEDDFGNSMHLEVARRMMRRPDRYDKLQELFTVSTSADYLELTFLHKIVVGQCHVDLDTTLQSRSPDILALVDVPDILGETPLMYAVRRGQVDQVKALIDAGAAVNLKKKNGASALSLAATSPRSSCEEIVQLLITAGADVGATDSAGGTALHMAAMNNMTGMLEKLLSVGARANARDYKRSTPLHYAAKYDSPETVRLLASRGADINAKHCTGMTALEIAICHNYHKTIAAFLESGAGRLYQDSGLLHLAARYGDTKTFRILTSFEPRGLDIIALDKHGRTACEAFERRPKTSSRLRSAFYSLIEAVGHDESEEDFSESQDDCDDETFVDAAEFLEEGSQIS